MATVPSEASVTRRIQAGRQTSTESSPPNGEASPTTQSGTARERAYALELLQTEHLTEPTCFARRRILISWTPASSS